MLWPISIWAAFSKKSADSKRRDCIFATPCVSIRVIPTRTTTSRLFAKSSARTTKRGDIGRLTSRSIPQARGAATRVSDSRAPKQEPLALPSPPSLKSLRGRITCAGISKHFSILIRPSPPKRCAPPLSSSCEKSPGSTSRRRRMRLRSLLPSIRSLESRHNSFIPLKRTHYRRIEQKNRQKRKLAPQPGLLFKSHQARPLTDVVSHLSA